MSLLVFPDQASAQGYADAVHEALQLLGTPERPYIAERWALVEGEDTRNERHLVKLPDWVSLPEGANQRILEAWGGGTWQPSIAQAARAWEPGIAVEVDEILSFSGDLWQVIQAHTTQADWQPPDVPALFRRFYDPEDGPQPWVQPTGAHDAYQTGDEVTHPDRANTMGEGSDTVWVWRSNIDANTAEPGQDGTFHRWWEPLRIAT